jgi:poly(hydroxyalkanoate) depolymerase family esterase
VLELKKLLANLARDRGNWRGLMHGVNTTSTSDVGGTHLEEVHGFGTNPGNLRMFRYLPSGLAAEPALVVVLHGCTQTAAGYDLGAGWSTLSNRYGFALLLPEQQRANNPNGCFNWFQPGDIERGQGECLSIRQMIEAMIVDKGIDRRRVFVTGLSAGGAMTAVMLACYPEVFAGGAIIAGLPYGAATSVQQAFQSMHQCPERPARVWGDLVRGAAPHKGAWPHVSIWHGSADKTVVPGNANEILKQWTDVHGLALTPAAQDIIDGYPRQAWVNAAGDEVIESYAVTHMAHGTPLATGAADGECGAAGPFLLEVGISSSYHIAKFFGLAKPRDVDSPEASAAAAQERRLQIDLQAQVKSPERDQPNEESRGAGTKPADAPRTDIGAIIAKALTAAGLMK